MEIEREGDYSAGMSPISILSTNFNVGSLLRELNLNAEFLDNMLNQMSTSEVERVLDEHVPAPYSDKWEPKTKWCRLTPCFAQFLFSRYRFAPYLCL